MCSSQTVFPSYCYAHSPAHSTYSTIAETNTYGDKTTTCAAPTVTTDGGTTTTVTSNISDTTYTGGLTVPGKWQTSVSSVFAIGAAAGVVGINHHGAFL